MLLARDCLIYTRENRMESSQGANVCDLRTLQQLFLIQTNSPTTGLFEITIDKHKQSFCIKRRATGE